MKREIRFRAWDKQDNRMHYNVQDISKFDGDFFTGTNHFNYFLKHPIMEVMQFTGLLDKNGKEIYEGDIVKSFAEEDHKDRDKEINVVLWRDSIAKWGLSEIKTFNLDDFMDCGYSGYGLDFDWGGWEEHEIIGNIYENSELTKKV